MINKGTVLLFFVFLITNSIYSNSKDAKIEKKLDKLFLKGKYEKCYKTALKYNSKFSASNIPEFYISKVHLHNYSSSSNSSQRKYSELKRAAIYSSKLPEDYLDWKSSVKDSLRHFIVINHDSVKVSKSNAKALKFYTKHFKDTLSFYAYYFPDLEKRTKAESNVYLFKSDSLRAALVEFARIQDGITYTYAGEKPETGFDCSGFTKYVYGHIGVDLPHNAHQQSLLEGENKPLDDAKTGDLVFFGSKNESRHYTQHAGIIYSVEGDNIKVVHCVSGGVSIDGKDSSWENYWKDKVLFVKSLSVFEED